MITTTIFPGRYVQGAHTLQRLGTEIKRFGSNAFFICSPHVFSKIMPDIGGDLKEHISYVIEQFKRECTDEEIERLVLAAKKSGCDVIIGIGGGKTLDTTKAVAYELKLPVVIIPTVASTDAPCSALSVIYTQAGAFKRYLVLPKNPDLVLLDTNIIAHAPSRYLVSGMGDALATWFESESCKNSCAKNMSGDIGSMTAYALAEFCYMTLLEYGVQAKLACDKNVVVPALEHVVEANTLLSGLGFESGGLATAHAIHNGLTALTQTHQFFHGEKVGIGVLASLFITVKPKDLIQEVFGFCEEIGLPITLTDIGLADVTDEDLMKVAALACGEGETIFNEIVAITPEIVFAALKTVESYGQNWRNRN